MAVGTMTRMIVMAGLLLAGTVFADLPTGSSLGSEKTTVNETYNLDMLIADLDLAGELWVSAKLDNDDGLTEQYRNELIALINYDIAVSEQLVRGLARDVALARIEMPENDHTPSNEIPDGLVATFEAATKRLNTKESLYRSLTKSVAFSNEYRLLGDYIDLLRRELKMPRLKLAHTNRSQSTSPEGQPPIYEK